MRKLYILLFAAVFSVAVRAQEAESASIPAEAEASTPAVLIGQNPELRALAERTSPNYLTGGIAISQMFTDNAELSTANKISDLSYDIVPHLAIRTATPRLSVSLGAVVGFLVNRTQSERNQATEGANFDLSYRAAQFVTLRFSDRFTNTTGMWSGVDVGSANTGDGIGPVQQSNSSLFTYRQFRSNAVLAEVSAQIAANTFGGFRATESYLTFPSGASDPVLGALYGGNTYSVEAFYNRHFTARNWGGIALRAQRFDINRSVGRTDTASILFLYAINIRANTSVSFFGGPELSVSALPQGVTPVPEFDRRLWSPAAGAVFSWQGQRTSAVASYTRQISNGGGLFSAVTLSSVQAQVMRQFGRRFEIGPAFAYAQNVPIMTSPAIRTYSGEIQSTYHIRNYAFSAGYARDDRTMADSNLTASANRAWVSFSYDFIKPLGR